MKKTVREILIEVNESDLKQIEAFAETEGRSRRAQIRMIITDWVRKEMAKLESGTREGQK